MSNLEDLKFLLNSFFKRRKSKKREMTRIFQWSRYLEWKDLTPEEKLSAKRFILLPLFSYLLIGFFNQNLFLIVLLLIMYVLYKRCEKGGIIKK
tara:strand:+ start:549 stop:830 length:282 start_codon:yes stop_codon:yes gene_type:complete